MIIVVVFNTYADGYWSFKEITAANVKIALNEEIPITYTRSWFARNVIKFEQWLTRLGGFGIAALFIGLFVTLFGLMIMIDYCCNKPREKVS